MKACTKGNKKQRKKLRKRNKVILILFLLFVVVMAVFALFVNPVLINTIELKSKAVSTSAINEAINIVVRDNVRYENLITITTDDLGNISMIQANAIEANNISRKLAQTTEKLIDDYGDLGVGIPLGSFSGIPILAGTGPDIKLKITPIGAVMCKFVSEFEQAGINQTIHRIYININANVGIVMPLYTKRFTSTQQVLISESIIVGSVPEVYLYSDSLSTLLNFVPY